MPAEIRCPDGKIITLPDGLELSPDVTGFENLTEADLIGLQLKDIRGIPNGFELTQDGKEPVVYNVTPTSVTSRPTGLDWFFSSRDKNHSFTLPGGATITPVREEKKKKR
jgi:hypothetical protein